MNSAAKLLPKTAKTCHKLEENVKKVYFFMIWVKKYTFLLHTCVCMYDGLIYKFHFIDVAWFSFWRFVGITKTYAEAELVVFAETE